jgi:hypothetical protein
MREVITNAGKIIYILSFGELPDYQEHRKGIRAFCPVHGSDHQRSLSITTNGEWAGWGRCFKCDARVILREEASSLPAQRVLAKAGYARRNMLPRPVKRQIPSHVSTSHRSSAPSWQEQEGAILRSLAPSLRLALADWLPGLYLEARMIPMETAQMEGVGFCSQQFLRGQPRFMQRWADRLIFPLRSPDGNGYIGRSLWGWRIGMDENEHKTLLEQDDHGPRRWIKTSPAGLFCTPPVDWEPCVILVEGSFDRLALLAAGVKRAHVVALVGTTLDPDWIPEQVQVVILALDGDAAGQEATQRLVSLLEARGIRVMMCVPPQDHRGKDWSERYRLYGQRGVQPVIDLLRRASEALRQEEVMLP